MAPVWFETFMTTSFMKVSHKSADLFKTIEIYSNEKTDNQR